MSNDHLMMHSFDQVVSATIGPWNGGIPGEYHGKEISYQKFGL
jgi:hypothetical protein